LPTSGRARGTSLSEVIDGTRFVPPAFPLVLTGPLWKRPLLDERYHAYRIRTSMSTRSIRSGPSGPSMTTTRNPLDTNDLQRSSTIYRTPTTSTDVHRSPPTSTGPHIVIDHLTSPLVGRTRCRSFEIGQPPHSSFGFIIGRSTGSPNQQGRSGSSVTLRTTISQIYPAAVRIIGSLSTNPPPVFTTESGHQLRRRPSGPARRDGRSRLASRFKKDLLTSRGTRSRLAPPVGPSKRTY